MAPVFPVGVALREPEKKLASVTPTQSFRQLSALLSQGRVKPKLYALEDVLDREYPPLVQRKRTT